MPSRPTRSRSKPEPPDRTGTALLEGVSPSVASNPDHGAALPSEPEPIADARARTAHASFVPTVVGDDVRVPLADGRLVRYINFDNAASTPVLRSVLAKVEEFLGWYANVHRGTGFKSRLSSWAFERSREKIAEFFGATGPERIVLFSKNTTEAINHLANRFSFDDDSVVVTTVMEHHSNELPWRRVARVVHVGVRPDGRVDDEELYRTLQALRGGVRLLAVTGASNVTGHVNPIRLYARWAHEVGAKIFVDAAQLAPHRPINMRSADHPERIDYLAFSAHKMYAPFGLGVLIGDRKTFEEGDPSLVGGGMVDVVTLESAYWTDLPDREEAGTPDIVGAVALAAALDCYKTLGWPRIQEHEAALTGHALARLSRIPGVTLYGDNASSYPRARLGVISFNVDSLPHALVSAVLSHEYGIGTRNGCFCAHPYVKCLLDVDESTARRMELAILARDRSMLIGAVRVSFGLYNTRKEVDRFADALCAIAAGNHRQDYVLDRERGEYLPAAPHAGFESFLSL